MINDCKKTPQSLNNWGIVEFDNFYELVKRIKNVHFYPDRIVLELVDNQAAVYTSIEILSMRIQASNGMTELLDIGTNYYKTLRGGQAEIEIIIEPQEPFPSMIIFFPGATAITFFGYTPEGEMRNKVFKKK